MGCLCPTFAVQALEASEPRLPLAPRVCRSPPKADVPPHEAEAVEFTVEYKDPSIAKKEAEAAALPPLNMPPPPGAPPRAPPTLPIPTGAPAVANPTAAAMGADRDLLPVAAGPQLPPQH